MYETTSLGWLEAWLSKAASTKLANGIVTRTDRSGAIAYIVSLVRTSISVPSSNFISAVSV